jgi:uncharacterized protein YndB with AHSA1/START domain
MNDSTAVHDGTMERTDGGGLIRFERHLDYSVADVWEAITDPDRLADWWLPFDADITVDLRAGGDMVFAGRGEDAPTMTFTIRRVDPPRLLEHDHADPGSFMRWELETAGTGGCILRLTHFVTDPAAAVDNCYVVGLHTSLSRLVPCLDGQPIAWDWDAFANAQAQYASIGLAPPLEEAR